MTKKRIVVLGVVILLIAAVTYSFVHYRQQQNSPLTLYGNVDIRTVNLGFRVNGRLQTLLVDEGDSVQPGQLLAKLDDAPYLNAVQQAQANVASAVAKLSLAQAGYREEEIAQVRAQVEQLSSAFDYAEKFFNREQGLWAKKAIAANAMDNARSLRDQAQANLQAAKNKLAQYVAGNRPQQIEEAKANLAQAEAGLAQAQLNLQDTLLLAPSSSTVMTRAVEPGTMLSAGSTVLTMSLTDPVWVRAYIDETNLGSAVPGQLIQIYTDSRPNHPYHGKIGFVSPTAEFTPKNVETADLRTALVYRLRIIVTDADDALRQGMPVTLRFAQP